MIAHHQRFPYQASDDYFYLKPLYIPEQSSKSLYCLIMVPSKVGSIYHERIINQQRCLAATAHLRQISSSPQGLSRDVAAASATLALLGVKLLGGQSLLDVFPKTRMEILLLQGPSGKCLRKANDGNPHMLERDMSLSVLAI